MKKKLCAFLAAISLVLLVVPSINLYHALATQNSEKWWKRKVLYNMDFILPTLSKIVYPLGFSIDPERTIIGKDGWLYLGDAYTDSITAKRTGFTLNDINTLEKIAKSAASWNSWLKSHGVQAFHIILGPDKDSIYPEYLPLWSRHAPQSLTDALLNRVQADIYVNPATRLKQEKNSHAGSLYYKTDTHWNNLGAWLAFDEFSKQLATTHPELEWLRPPEGKLSSIVPRQGGDLAGFLRIQSALADHEVILDHPEYAIPIEHYDFESGILAFAGQNDPVAAPMAPLLVKSKQALNTKKVLWLRDSFGTAMAPFMAATFSDTLQVHYRALKPGALAELVERYRPDYVFITAVERDSRGAFFQTLAPGDD